MADEEYVVDDFGRHDCVADFASDILKSKYSSEGLLKLIERLLSVKFLLMKCADNMNMIFLKENI